MISLLRILLLIGALTQASLAAGYTPAYPKLENGGKQYASFPLPAEEYPSESDGLWRTLQQRMDADPFNLVATIIFALAIIHTFSSGFFMRLAHKFEHRHDEQLRLRGPKDDEHPDGVSEVSFAGTLFHFLGEIEAIFGIWVIVLAVAATHYHSFLDFELYLSEDRTFTEPLFVVIIMAIAASRPVLRFAESMISRVARIGNGSPTAWWLSVLAIAPVLGSFITEPAAMTIGALLLSKRFFCHNPPNRLAYATLGLLFVNVSIGGTLTNFAAPPVLMVAYAWEWSTSYMFFNFGLRALIAIALSCTMYYLFFRKDLFRICDKADGAEDGEVETIHWEQRETPIPAWVTFVHLAFLFWTVYTAHFPALFIGGFLFFLAFVMATRHHQNEVALRGPILVGFFLAALVIHGGCQAWWIAPVISQLSDNTLMLGAAILTAFNDNAAITYLASQVDGISAGAKYAVVAGAVVGGGLTVIANAPNPAGQSILGKHFKDGIAPMGLLLAALPPTIIAFVCYLLFAGTSAPAHSTSHDDPGHHAAESSGQTPSTEPHH